MTERHTFYDELGNEIEFVVKAKFSLDDTDYVALLPANEIDAMTYILRIEMDDEGDEILVGIDDDELEEAKDVYEELVKENLQ
ncbi:DUF1292 domain-containing protein [Gudongella sp. SC589]|jgi:hypothetical protein|uniref:DUF1292 domain-containing protein n=1 Tax=Gudongella sp. SC589 TaxID=3385990 RepID=UPI003904B84E